MRSSTGIARTCLEPENNSATSMTFCRLVSRTPSRQVRTGTSTTSLTVLATTSCLAKAVCLQSRARPHRSGTRGRLRTMMSFCGGLNYAVNPPSMIQLITW